MVEIISKSDGPRREDAAAKHFLRENAATITKIADQLSGGRRRNLATSLSPSPTPDRRPRTAPSRDAEKKPYTKISLNGRVVAVDFNTGRQLHLIGEIRGKGAVRRFVLARAENGFFASLDDELVKLLWDIDGRLTPNDVEEEQLVQTIDARLGYAALDDAR